MDAFSYQAILGAEDSLPTYVATRLQPAAANAGPEIDSVLIVGAYCSPAGLGAADDFYLNRAVRISEEAGFSVSPQITVTVVNKAFNPDHDFFVLGPNSDAKLLIVANVPLHAPPKAAASVPTANVVSPLADQPDIWRITGEKMGPSAIIAFAPLAEVNVLHFEGNKYERLKDKPKDLPIVVRSDLAGTLASAKPTLG